MKMRNLSEMRWQCMNDMRKEGRAKLAKERCSINIAGSEKKQKHQSIFTKSLGSRAIHIPGYNWQFLYFLYLDVFFTVS